MNKLFKLLNIRQLLAAFLLVLSVIAAGGCQNDYAYSGNAVYSLSSQSRLIKSPELFALVENNYREVQKKGAAELIIPKHMHTITRDDISKNCLYVVDLLKSHGFKSYLVGGSVRDLLIGAVCNDFDIITDATYEQLSELMPNVSLHTATTGKTFAYVPVNGEKIDVASVYNWPDNILGKPLFADYREAGTFQNDLISDAAARDLAFNAVYYDFDTEELIDYFAGIWSLMTNVVRTVEPDPRDLFIKEPHVAFRLIRFLSRYQMQLEPKLQAALTDMAPDLVKKADKNSFTKNLLKMDNKGFSKNCWDSLNKYRVLPEIFPAAAYFTGQSSYLAYMDDLLVRVDATYPHASKGYSILMIGGALWPAVEAELKHSTIEKSISKVLDSQSQIFDYSLKPLREGLNSLLYQEYLMTHIDRIDNMQKFCSSDVFAPALEILRSRSLNNEDLAGSVKYFESMALKGAL